MNENTTVLEKPTERINSYQKAEIIEKLVQEVPQREIARQYNARQPNISIIKKNNQELIDRKKAELIKLIPCVVDTTRDDVHTNGRLSKHISLDFTAVTSEQIALKNSLDKTNVNLLKIAGIFPSQALINYNLNQDNRTQTTVISDNVLGLFAPHAKELIEAEVVATNEDTTNE